MKISDCIGILEKEQSLERTPRGRAISEIAIKTIEATLQDKKNYNMDAIQCLGCGLIVSSLLISEGCSNCGVIDMTLNIIDK